MRGAAKQFNFERLSRGPEPTPKALGPRNRSGIRATAHTRPISRSLTQELALGARLLSASAATVRRFAAQRPLRVSVHTAGRRVTLGGPAQTHVTLTLQITMAVVEPELFIKVFCVIMGMYGLQMLAVPAKMVTDHFDAPATPLLQFWIRGSSCAFLTIVYLVKFKLATEDAVPVALAMSVACGALYPWNAKFGYLSPGLPTKYPMHYVPEVLMAVLTGLGIAAMM